MGITLAKIANNSARVTFKYGEDDVTLEYYPAKVTEKVFARLQAFGKMDESNMIDQFAAFNNTLCDLIKTWDVYEDDNQTITFPLAPDRLAELPFAFRLSCIQAIMRDIRPNEAAPQTS